MKRKKNSLNWKLVSYILIVTFFALMSMSFSGSTNEGNNIPSISPVKVGEYFRIKSTFGMRIHPVYKIEKFHYGIDFEAEKGTKIVATANGVVTKIEFKKGGHGETIIINHGGEYETRYMQLNDYSVKQGDKVKRGDVIGHVGNSGLSTEPHLHYEVRKNGKPVNPEDYIKN